MKILIDSDFLFGLFVPDDAHHNESRKEWMDLEGKNHEFFISNLVIQETATVLSYKRGQVTAVLFLKRLPSLKLTTVVVDSSIEKRAWELFESQTKKGISFVDCSNLTTIEKYRLDGILSFDKFYPKEILISG